MKKINTYTFNNICYFLIFLLLVGCGNTPTISDKQFKIFNANSTSLIVRNFKLTKLQKVTDFEKLPKEFDSFKHQINQFDLFLAQSPTQNSGLYHFIAVEGNNSIKICLKKPEPLAISLGVVTNPIALVITKKGLIVEDDLGYCQT